MTRQWLYPLHYYEAIWRSLAAAGRGALLIGCGNTVA